MTDFRNRLKQNQGGSDIPKMETSMWLTAKASKEGKPGFVWQAEDPQTKVKTEKFQNLKITGVLLGTGMVLSAYSKDLGAKGGSFHSTVYFRKTDAITLFGPSNAGYKKEMTGDYDQVEDFLTVKRRTISSLDKTKKQMVLYILTEKSGLIEIRTNLSLGIDQTQRVKKGSPEFLVSVTAGMYNAADANISVSAKKNLGALADKNPPCYCVISVTETPITDAWATATNLDKHLDDFEHVKAYAASATATTDTATDAVDEPVPAGSGATAFDENPLEGIPTDTSDDLPF